MQRAFGFILAMSAAYLLSTSRERPWNDGSHVYFTAERLVARGTTALDMPALAAPNGTMQSPHPLLVSLVHVPGVILKRLWRPLWRGGETHLLVLASHLAPAVLMASTCWLFLQMCLWLGVRRNVARGMTLVLAFATITWVYARSPWPPAVESFVFTGFLFCCLRVATVQAQPDDSHRALPWHLGAWAAFLINTKWSFVLLLPATGGYLVWRLRDRPELRAELLRKALPLVTLGGVWVLIESRWRFGSFAFVPVLVWREPMQEGIFLGLWGVLLSPGKSLFIYSLPLVLGALGLRTLWRDERWDVLALLATTAGVFMLYLAKLSHWTGDWAWGARHCVFLTPALLLPAAAFVEKSLQKRRFMNLALACALVMLGAGTQVLGNGLYWDHYIRIAKHARIVWLGTPQRGGALSPTTTSDCDPCFEDIHPLIWLAPFNPIEGHAWLLRHVVRGDSAAKAEADAAWHRYTALNIPIDELYGRARLDWWFLNFLPKRAVKGSLALVALMALSSAGVLLNRRARMRQENLP